MALDNNFAQTTHRWETDPFQGGIPSGPIFMAVYPQILASSVTIPAYRVSIEFLHEVCKQEMLSNTFAYIRICLLLYAPLYSL